jgi:hypothetical protein
MCTVILLRRPGHAWPALMAANRDERLDRAWDEPAAWWPAQPEVFGGRDRTAGGTWMAANRAGVVAAVLNRVGSLGPAPDKRSRGELPLLALAEDSAEAAARAIATLPGEEWKPFNMVVFDHRAGFFLRGLGRGHAAVVPLAEGISMVTAHDPNDLASPRTARHLPRFRATPPPNPASDDWAAWERLLADGGSSPEEGRAAALNVPPLGGFGTISSSLLALDATGGLHWRFAAGPPDTTPFRPVEV